MAVFLPSFFLESSLALAASLPQTFDIGRRTNILSNENALDRRTVWDPKITQPTRQTVWTRNMVANVTWNTDDMPEDAKNQKGEVVLGWQKQKGGSEHLDIAHPLASGFHLRDGHVQIIVPQVQPRDNYIIVLFGDSGNASPNFSIV